MFQAMFKAKVVELRSLFLATSGIEHRGEKGGFREAFVKSLLNQFLPVQFGIGSGVVVDINGCQSPQIDIVIYDKRRLPPIFERDGSGVYPIDSVVRVVEVKSVVNPAAVAQFSKLVASFDPTNDDGLKLASHMTDRGAEEFYPVCAMFGFENKISHLGEACFNDEYIPRNDALVYVDNGELWGVKYGVDLSGFDKYGGKYMNVKKDPDLAVRMFLAVLLNKIEVTANSREPFDPLKWLISAK
jgi:hypothetical protein